MNADSSDNFGNFPSLPLSIPVVVTTNPIPTLAALDISHYTTAYPHVDKKVKENQQPLDLSGQGKNSTSPISTARTPSNNSKDSLDSSCDNIEFSREPFRKFNAKYPYMANEKNSILSGQSDHINSENSGDNQDVNLNRKYPKTTPDDCKDSHYWQRRIRNNEAARRSRRARRNKEDSLAHYAAHLEQVNAELRAEINLLKEKLLTLT